MKGTTLRYLGAEHTLTAEEGLVLPDGTIWSHAAVLGKRFKGEEFMIGAAEVQNAVKVFTTGYPKKVPVDYEHASTTSDPEVRKLRAQGQVPKAGDVAELKAVLSADDFTGELKTAATKLSTAAGRELSDPRNFGLWMRWKPTSRALAAVKAGEYTELSIAFDEDVPNNVDGAGQGFGILAVALCMRPFLDDMLPVAASGDTDTPPARKPASREGSMKHLGALTALAAVFASTVTSDDDAAIELPKILPKVRSNHEFTSVVSAEFANEQDPAKVVKVVRELKAENDRLKAEKTEATKGAAKATAEATIKEFEAAIGSKPLREMLLRQLTGELEAGKKLEDSETMATLKSLPKAKNLGQRSGADAASEGEMSADQILDAKARELMTTDPRLKALAATNEHEAYKQALFAADKIIRSA